MADQNVRTFDPKQVIITFGPVIITGFAEGTFITIVQSGPSFEKVKGADGSINRINKNANDHTATMTLQETSISNDALSTIHIADKLSNTGKHPLTVTDLSGTSKFFAPQAWITQPPDAEKADVLSTREWAFDTGIAAHFIGGNNV